ncbi:MAG: hypothetical protein IKP00_04450 [Victivallales bacterium]|nr:hypothetical protein [Victivallales bacterium]
MRMVMMLVLAFSVENRYLRIAMYTVFGYAKAMLRAFSSHLMLMHEG